ncbi:MAG: aspartyl-tRNA(Asn)/glutamyl-tRNA(Gln) amidotransferase subunit A [Limisphaerales bacterium]
MISGKSVHELIAGLEKGDFSAQELTQLYLDKADSHNAILSLDHEGALHAARQADEDRAAGRAGPLTGVPIVHKDIFLTKDLITTAGSRMLENFVAPYNATVVSRLEQAGAITLGKANMDEFAMGSSNENSYFGAVTNPWDVNKVPGGSSGGSAAVVAAGLAPAATGTDTGGSIRQPAAFCGITGLKPTYGRISRYGMIAFASSLDQAGPLTKDAKDAGLLLAVMAGFDPRDSTSAERQDTWLTELPERGLAPASSLTIGLPKEYFSDFSGAHIDAVKKAIEDLGHSFVEMSLPTTDAAIPAYYVIAGAEASTNLSRYDGVRFGHRCESPVDLQDLYKRSRSEGFGAEVKRRILTGTYALSVGYYDAYYLQAQKIRRLLANDFDQAFTKVDVLLTPTTPGPAFSRGELTEDPVAMYQQDKYTVPVSLAGLPALSMPAGIQANLPVGVQLIAPAFREDTILSLAEQFQQVTDWHLKAPAFTGEVS